MRILPRQTSSNSQQAGLRQTSLLETTQLAAPQLSQQFIHSLASNPIEALEAWRASDETRQKNAVRWHPQHMPIGVFLAPPEQQPEKQQLHPETLQQLLTHALEAWEKASLGQIRFQHVSEETANLQILWTPTATLGRDYEVGHTQRHVQGRGWITQATITLLYQPVIDGYLSPEQQLKRLQATFLHEIGHALGLEHAQHKSDVMYYRGWQNSQLTSRDADALQALYQEKPDLLLF